jgi:pyruvate formate-lyase/glycerol dehydratase family glycyl radical enzyme
MKSSTKKNCDPGNRISRLRDSIILAEKEVCIERARLVTEAYKETEGEPTAVRRAKALRKILEGMSIYISDGELIVGNQASKIRNAPLFPEYSYKWILEDMDSFDTRPGDKFRISEEKKGELRKLLSYWKGKTLADRILSIVPEDIKTLIDMLVIHPHKIYEAVAEICVDYEKVLKRGFNEVKTEIENKLAELNPTSPEYCRKLTFYKAELITCDAIVNFARRYAAKARELAEKERDAKRKKELETIATICDKVPAQPAETFWEALQSLWFIQVVIQIESNGLGVTIGRFDQYMYPYYRKDIDEGRLSQAEAQELLEAFWVKTNEPIKIWNNEGAKLFAGFPMTQNIVIGGVLPDGGDAINELSYMCLDAEAHVRLHQPAFSVRLYSKTPDDFLLRVCEVIKAGSNKPKLFNDNAGIAAALRVGATLAEARDYVPVGCVETTIPGKTFGWHFAGMVNLGKCLELALNDGVDPFTERQIGPKTGDPIAFESFAELMRAYKTQVSYVVKQMVTVLNIADTIHAELAPMPFMSLLVSNCIEKGLDITAGGAKYNFTGPEGGGIPTVADSLTAVKKFVFEEKKVTMDELKNALSKNFEGYEELRQMLLDDAPKYGNDEDYVDFIAREVELNYCSEVDKYINPRGGKYTAGVYTVSSNVPLGEVTGATPDGRKAREPFGENISPCQGRDRKGPTAVLKSVTKLDHIMPTAGTLLNMRFNLSAVEGPEKLARFASLIRAYVELGGYHIQFNMVSEKVLRDAQKHPENYRDLLVRVAAYNAFFVEISKELQDDIIARTEFQDVY